MIKESEIQKENLDKLLELIKSNPRLKIVPKVDSTIIGEEDFSYWLGSFGESEIDYLWSNEERAYFKSDDFEDLVDSLLNDMDTNNILENLNDEDLLAQAENTIEKLEWEQVIVVNIKAPY